MAYKTRWYGSVLLVADRFYPSSKTCSRCGAVKAKLRLAERTFTCDACGLVADRDDNASRNLQALIRCSLAPDGDGLQWVVAGSGPDTSVVRGDQVRPRRRVGHRSGKREAGTSRLAG
jgi:putative transposase